MFNKIQHSNSTVARVRHALYRFLKTRPTVGCVLLALGGYFVLKPVIGSTFFVPAQRHFPALMALAFSITSLPLANLGGWLIGMVLGIVGSGLIFAWTPYSEKQLWRIEEKAAEKLAKKQARKHGHKAVDPGMASAA
jgi:hypothetical protein